MTEPSHRRGKVVDDNILRAAISVIEESGTLLIKVDRVAELAGVNKTTIYRRFPNRDDLVLAAILAQAETVVPIPDAGSLRGDLWEIVVMVRSTVMSSLGRALLSASAASPDLDQLRPTYWQTRFEAAAKVIDRAVERGECSPPADPQLLIELMVAPIHFRATQVGVDISDEFLAVQVDRLVAALR